MQIAYILSYDPRMPGGVTGVVGDLVRALPELRILPILGCYGKPVRSALFSLRALMSLLFRLIVDRPRAVIVVIGSRGDVIRTFPFILTLRAFGTGTVLYFHKNLPNILSSHGRLTRIAIRVWSASDRLVFLSDRLAKAAAGYGLPGRKMTVIPNGLGRAWLSGECRAFAERSVDVAFFGRWSPEKGVADLQRLFSPAFAGERFCCHVYGANRMDEVGGSFVFHGWCSQGEVMEAMRNARLVVLPSYSEAYPTILLEAAAAGTPFVSTSIAGIPDIAEASGAGVVVAPGDVDGMSAAVRDILDDRRRWEKLSADGYAWVQNQSVGLVAERWRKLLHNLKTVNRDEQ